VFKHSLLDERKEKPRMIHKISITIIIIALILSAAPLIAGSPEKEKAAVISAEKWLTLVDEERYSESWTEAAEYFKNAVTQEQWKQAAQGARKPLGKVVTRKVKTKSYRTSLPGAPDGEYVVIQFDTSFVNKKAAVETVTL